MHDYFKKKLFDKLCNRLNRQAISLNNKNVLISSCGNGIDILYLLKRHKAVIFAADISGNVVEFTLKKFPQFNGQVEDNENLSFRSQTIFLTIVRWQ